MELVGFFLKTTLAESEVPIKLLTLNNKCHSTKDFDHWNVYAKTKENDENCLVLLFISW